MDTTSDRYHRAARDGFLDLLQEANRKELNTRDEDGMTPAMWAAYYGHLDALRLIVGRGGDPDKCDHYGNTCLHCSSGNGHIDCVSFLVNFGVNLWALDNDFHTAKDVAVLNRRDDVLRLLDQAQSKHGLVNKKLVQRLKEKSVYDAEKRIKSYRKMQQKAAKRAEKEERERLTKKDSSRPAPKFSDIVNSDCNNKQQRKKTVAFRPVVRRVDEDDSPCGSPDHDASAADSGIGDDLPEGGGGGIFERPGFGTVAFRRGELLGPILKTYDGSEEDHRKVTDSIGSAGSLLARRHITWEDECEETSHHDADDDQTDDDEEEEDDDDEDDNDHEDHQLSLLLAALGLSEFLPIFQAERIDLEALSLLSEGDLKAVGMPLGPRRKLEKALRERRRILEEPGAFLDSAL